MAAALPHAPAREAGLQRNLGVWSASAIVLGLTIGSGIFRLPAVIAVRAPQPGWMLGVWVAGGLLTLCGALAVAELGASLPHTGGFYVFLREAWGPPVGFLYGWGQLVLTRASITGGISLVFGEYLLRSLGVDPVAHDTLVRSVAAAAVMTAMAANIRAARLGASIVNAATAAKVIALVLLITAAFALGGANGGSVDHLSAPASGPVTWEGLGLGLISVLFAYDGFADVCLIAGEVSRPEKTLPRAVITGTVAIVGVYVLANVAYLYVLPLDVVRRSPLVAADMMFAILGNTGARMVSALVALSTFSSLMAIILASPRIFYAMAADGLFFSRLASVHPKYGTPYLAIALTGALGIVFLASQTFERLAVTSVLALWPFYALSVAALYRLRRTRPDLARPYEAAGYPVVPALFIAAVVLVVFNAIVAQPFSTLVTFAALLAGIPVYALLKRRTS